jgi:hypothetical protein
MRSSNLRISLAAILLALLAAPVPARADKNDDNYARGQAAVNNGDAVAARDAFCAVDAGYKDAAQQCALYTGEAKRQLARYNQNFLEGVQLMQDGKLDQAEIKFKNVKAGERVADAQRKLQEIQKLRQEQAAAAAAAKTASEQESAQRQRLEQGRDAFNRGDYASARSILQGVGGSAAGEAQALLGRIAAAEQAQQQSQESSRSAAGNAASMVKQVVRQVDVAGNIALARKAIDKEDFNRARRLLGEVLATDAKNKDARELIASLPQEASTGKSTVGEEDPQLAAAISKFYQGNYGNAEDDLRFYLGSGGKKKGLGNFYMGALILTRWYLAGATSMSDPQYREAVRRFKDASEQPGFVPPEKYISPKILKVYTEVAGKPSGG